MQAADGYVPVYVPSQRLYFEVESGHTLADVRARLGLSEEEGYFTYNGGRQDLISENFLLVTPASVFELHVSPTFAPREFPKRLSGSNKSASNREVALAMGDNVFATFSNDDPLSA